ncbi:HAMP domain-containing histidine kinase [Candidatus Nomurabacteria bacterium]|nr:HAMP domain-containing histidine kinase [Candidatus Nomurabacteria bacterium]
MNEEEIKKLKEENERLRQLCAIKSDIISISAHQIRTSLSALKWIIKMFLDGDLGKITFEQENLLRKAYESNDRSINTVNDLLLANKTENVTEKEYIFESVNMVEIIEKSIFDFSGESYNNGIEIIFLKPNEKIQEVKADKEKIRVVFQNLLENAIKYSNYHGKIFIGIRMNEENFIEVSVKDTGIEISEENKSKIFEKFYRTPEAQKKEVVGSGIGLFTVKKIVENHGGKIWFNSEKGSSTTFFFTIPIF